MNKKTISRFFAIFTVLSTILSLSGCGLKSNTEAELAQIKVTLDYWRVFDGRDDFQDLITQYTALHPNVTINYRKLRYEEYERELLEAFATDRGPDILSLHNTWLNSYQSRGLISPMPEAVNYKMPVVKGSIKKETFIESRTAKMPTTRDVRNNFVDAVGNDVIIVAKDKDGKSAEKIFGLPLSVDTLALFYNKNLFNNAGIAEPPQYWNKTFQQSVKKLTKQDAKGQLIQSGVALGSSVNVDRYFDILSVLMMQNGAQMTDGDSVTFNMIPSGFKDRTYNPGLEALKFYVDFSNPGREVYSWNKDLENSLSLFMQEKVAMIFGYSYHLPTIKAGAPKLNLGVANMPQIEGNVEMNYANYWVETVANKSKNKDLAWDFINFITKAENVKGFLDKTKKPTALRALRDKQSEDLDIGIFASQVLTAKSWYHGMDPSAAEQVFYDMITSVSAGNDTAENAINIAVGKMQQTMRPKKDY